MDCVCKLCGGTDSQHHIFRECSHKNMLPCRDKHVALLKRRSRDITGYSTSIWQAAPYFEVYLDFAFRPGKDSGAYKAWTRILDPRLIEELEGVIFGEDDTITTALLKECRGLAECAQELHRIRRKLM